MSFLVVGTVFFFFSFFFFLYLLVEAFWVPDLYPCDVYSEDLRVLNSTL